MKPLFFITSNHDKLREVRALLPHVQGIELDLMEVQELDAHKILAAKLAEAQKYHPGPFIVEDTSLSLDAMNGLPGPLVRWFLQAIGCEGIFQLTTLSQNARATAQTLIGYAAENGSVHFLLACFQESWYLRVEPMGLAGIAFFSPMARARPLLR